MPTQLDQIWDDIREELRRATPDFKFHIWIEPLELAGVSGTTLYVRAPEYIRTSVSERYLPLLRRAAAARFDRRAVVEVVGAGWSAPPDKPPGGEAAAGEDPEPEGDSDRLNPRYTFDQFVIGEGNRFAHAAALAVAELPGQAYNPLFLHGPPGLGKTHLLHAIGNYMRRFESRLRVRYATIEKFTTEFVGAVREHRTGDFKDGFRNADVVLLDDVQFLAGRAKTSEEFFHTFNALVDSGRQLVLSSDRSPEELPDVEARLRERFRAGLVVEIDPPPASVRRAILAKRARLDGVDVSDDVLAEIAERVHTSVRALEGGLIRVVAYASLRGEEPTPGLARHVLDKLAGNHSQAPRSVDELIDVAAKLFGLTRDTLIHDKRRHVSRRRHATMYVAHKLLGFKHAAIAQSFHCHHSTIKDGIGTVTETREANPEKALAVEKLSACLGLQPSQPTPLRESRTRFPRSDAESR